MRVLEKEGSLEYVLNRCASGHGTHISLLAYWSLTHLEKTKEQLLLTTLTVYCARVQVEKFSERVGCEMDISTFPNKMHLKLPFLSANLFEFRSFSCDLS
jgi:hypothetical protein